MKSLDCIINNSKDIIWEGKVSKIGLFLYLSGYLLGCASLFVLPIILVLISISISHIFIFEQITFYLISPIFEITSIFLLFLLILVISEFIIFRNYDKYKELKKTTYFITKNKIIDRKEPSNKIDNYDTYVVLNINDIDKIKLRRIKFLGLNISHIDFFYVKNLGISQKNYFSIKIKDQYESAQILSLESVQYDLYEPEEIKCGFKKKRHRFIAIKNPDNLLQKIQSSPWAIKIV